MQYKDIKKVLFGNEKVIVTSGKGGCGKTTTAVHSILTSIYLNNGGKKVRYIEIDDVNKSIGMFGNSQIMTCEKIAVKRDDELSIALMEEENIVFDIGGNKTSEKIITEIGENGDLDNLYWVIPLSKGETDAVEAVETYRQICEIYDEQDLEPKILFVLNNVVIDEEDRESNYKEALELQFSNVFGSDYLDVKFVLENEIAGDLNFITFEYTPLLEFSSSVKKTMYEISYGEDEKIAKENKAAAQKNFLAATEDKKEELEKERRKAVKTVKYIAKIKKFTNRSLLPQFSKIVNFITS